MYASGLVSQTPSVILVKFTDPVTKMECDVNINERLGLLNSLMIKHYCDISPVLRPMLHLIKRWAKPRGLNSPSIDTGKVTFSSYALTLMTIGFLQVSLRSVKESTTLRLLDSSPDERFTSESPVWPP